MCMQRPITVNMGMRMAGWFDITSLDKIDQREDAAGLKESAQLIEDLVKEEQSSGINKCASTLTAALRSAPPARAVRSLPSCLPMLIGCSCIPRQRQGSPNVMDWTDCHGHATSRVVVAGFSQGGAVALLLLRSQLKLAGVAGLSTWLTLPQEELLSAQNQDTPLWMAHGTADQVVSALQASLTLPDTSADGSGAFASPACSPQGKWQHG